MKIFYKVAMMALIMLASVATSAQSVLYTMSASPTHNVRYEPVAQMTISYRPNGYDAFVNGVAATVTKSQSATRFSKGKLVGTVSAGYDWWFPKQVGIWHEAPVVTAYGDRGVMRIMYAGLTPYGRQYHDEMWLNGKLFSRTTTVFDHSDHIVWSESEDEEGFLRLDRIN